MGKRARRRRREAVAKAAAVVEPTILRFPHGEESVLQVEVAPDATPEDLALIHRYWDLTAYGWRYKVRELGSTLTVLNAVTAYSRAFLLSVGCSLCGEPIEIANRSAGTVLAGPTLTEPRATGLCPDCLKQHTAVKEQQQRLAAQQAEQENRKAREAEEELRQRVVVWTTREREAPCVSETVDGNAELVLLLALAERARAGQSKPLPALSSLESGWTGDVERDAKALSSLREQGLLVVDAQSPLSAFQLGEGGGLMYGPAEVLWTLKLDPDATIDLVAETCVRRATAIGQQSAAEIASLARLVTTLEATHVIDYLNSLLTKKYGYPPVPETREVELFDTIVDGITGGYTTGQMIAIVWRAADSAAAWKERNARMGPPEASSATVTMVRRKLDDARERRQPVPEYEPPRWLSVPAALGAARQVLEAVEGPRRRDRIAACNQCDINGFVSDEVDGREVASRCLHLPSARRPDDDHIPADH
ncbi:hypothetical protein ACIRVF_38715 [Kitasatospora sp. NPDC101157]|uniref:hypothetical protein n=1 Tax=Kitasatospora sp. NPDC101157 TaxID=3364098 RepID=UPI0038140625